MPRARELGRMALIAASALVILGATGLVGLSVVGRLPWRAHDEPRLVRANVRLAPDLDMLGELSPSAVYVIKTGAGLVLIDSGLAADAAGVREAMSRLGRDWGQIRGIFLTHAHGDHTGGAAWLSRNAGATVYAGAGDADVLRAGGPREAFFSTYHMPGESPHPTPVAVALKGGETIDLGDARMTAIAAPGHTPGSMCYLLERDGKRILFAGDVIMMLKGDDHPRDELGKPLGTYSAYLSPRYRGDARASLATLRRLRALPVPDLVLPGHPRADNQPQDPRLTQGGWEKLLDAGIRDMETLVARYDQEGADFLDGVPKELLPDLYYLGDFHDRAVYAFRVRDRLILIDAPGGPGLIPFLANGLSALGISPTAPAAVLLTATGAAETAGLPELIKTHHVMVVAPGDAIEDLRQSLPPGTDLTRPEEFPTERFLPLKAISLRGRGSPALAYSITWAGKSVLCSGLIPVKISPESTEWLARDLSGSRDHFRDYLASIQSLNGQHPDLWLPATAIHGQNANLHDHEWLRTLEDNLTVLMRLISARR